MGFNIMIWVDTILSHQALGAKETPNKKSIDLEKYYTVNEVSLA